ncbi:MAG: DinB family protein [Flavobacterium sp.]|nr:MAG: DinB family protein [Flavobacterium sp.]
MKSNELESGEYAPYYQTYINALDNSDLIEDLEISLYDFIKFVQDIPIGKHEHRYAEGKWTIKDIIQHLIDAERIFSYRALCIARQDKTPLPSFEENAYVDSAHANARHLKSLLEEFSTVRQSTLLLYKSFSDQQLKSMGTASGVAVSVRAIGFIIIGHLKHHQIIFKERYLDPSSAS